jgi:hypothetical protein
MRFACLATLAVCQRNRHLAAGFLADQAHAVQVVRDSLSEDGCQPGGQVESVGRGLDIHRLGIAITQVVITE